MPRLSAVSESDIPVQSFSANVGRVTGPLSSIFRASPYWAMRALTPHFVYIIDAYLLRYLT